MLFNEDPGHERRWEEREREVLSRHYANKFRAEMPASAPPAPQAKPQPLSDESIERGRQATFSTNNPFCPCDSKTMRKDVRWAEAAHGIKE